jgi:hypothetical protein
MGGRIIVSETGIAPEGHNSLGPQIIFAMVQDGQVRSEECRVKSAECGVNDGGASPVFILH